MDRQRSIDRLTWVLVILDLAVVAATVWYLIAGFRLPTDDSAASVAADTVTSQQAEAGEDTIADSGGSEAGDGITSSSSATAETGTTVAAAPALLPNDGEWEIVNSVGVLQCGGRFDIPAGPDERGRLTVLEAGRRVVIDPRTEGVPDFVLDLVEAGATTATYEGRIDLSALEAAGQIRGAGDATLSLRLRFDSPTAAAGQMFGTIEVGILTCRAERPATATWLGP